MSVMHLSLDEIRIDGGTQPRESNNEAVIASYAEDMRAGAQFPPLVVFFDGIEYWLADGFHRYWAAKSCEYEGFECDVREGTRRDAILFSVGANASHGLRRSNADKRKAVLTLLNDEEWGKWSDREIARRCGVSQPFVGQLRPAPADTANGYQYERTFVHPKTGKPTTMNTAAIGKRAEPVETPEPAEIETPAVEAAPVAEPAAVEPEPAPVEDATFEPEAPAEADDAARKELAKLTREALEDDVIGLRADLADAKRKIKEQKAEIERLKSDIAYFKQDDQGRALGNALRSARAAEGRMKEYQAIAVRADRYAKKLKAENAELQRKLENQIIEMD